ncbi:hypothetical protein GCWU000282_01039 [Catonella morbi ATCC 51271]|uniref:Uncharacterized protein n=1 Tax=Catonella morbi ATCC 51271 TaxID=592026 RepID=V2Y700_9FIRM|nr:hypothetical protein GCWU000282_01039 [Catonella morbi ATCC 51271]
MPSHLSLSAKIHKSYNKMTKIYSILTKKSYYALRKYSIIN